MGSQGSKGLWSFAFTADHQVRRVLLDEEPNWEESTLPIPTFVMTLRVFDLAQEPGTGIVRASLNSRKDYEKQAFQRSSRVGCAVSSVVEHFLDTEVTRSALHTDNQRQTEGFGW